MEIIKKGLVLILFLTLYMLNKCLSVEFCDQNDNKCQHPDNIYGNRYLHHDRIQQTNILRRLQQLSLIECVTKCFMISGCVAVNYGKDRKICDVLDELDVGENLRVEAGSIYAKNSIWSKTLAGSCTDYTCFAGDKCVELETGGIRSAYVYCTDPVQKAYNATCIETFGLYKNLKAGNQFKCKAGFLMIGHPFVICNENGEWNKMFYCRDMDILPRDCSDIPHGSGSGVYTISLEDQQFDVYCDMDTAGFGWTVFQTRTDGTINFYRGWSDYEVGFGNLKYEFWLGNNFIHLLTSTARYKLYIRLEDFNGNSRYAEYSEFSIGDAATNYMLNVDGYSGNADRDNDRETSRNCAKRFKGAWWHNAWHKANINGVYLGGQLSSFGDSLMISGHVNHNGMMFSTTDRDNDRDTSSSCAKMFKGAWWYNACHRANINGAYLGGQISSFADGIIWYTWKGNYYSLKSTKMMIKRY